MLRSPFSSKIPITWQRYFVLQRRIAEYLTTVEDPVERCELLAEALVPPAPTPEPNTPITPPDSTPPCDAAMHELVESLVDTMEASKEHVENARKARLAGQQPSDRGSTAELNEESTKVRESDDSYGRTVADADAAKLEDEEVVEDLLHTSPLQLLQACCSFAVFLHVAVRF